MSNSFIAKALAVLHRDKDIKDLDAFWSAVGRADLAGHSYADLAGSPMLQTLHYEASRVSKKRNAHVLVTNDGRELEVIKRAEQRRLPLDEFTHKERNGIAHHYSLRTTKGWTRARIEPDECEKYRELHKTPILARMPSGRAFARWRIAA